MLILVHIYIYYVKYLKYDFSARKEKRFVQKRLQQYRYPFIENDVIIPRSIYRKHYICLVMIKGPDFSVVLFT